MPLNLYLISQDENLDYDTYDSAVVCAEDEESARKIHPQGRSPWDENNWDAYSWCSSPELVKVTYIGSADEKLVSGVVCASFNAG